MAEGLSAGREGSKRVVGYLRSHHDGFDGECKSLYQSLRRTLTHNQTDEVPIYANGDLWMGRDKKKW